MALIQQVKDGKFVDETTGTGRRDPYRKQNVT